MKSITFVTGLWNLTNNKLFNTNEVEKLLKYNINLCIFIDPDEEHFISKYSNRDNTRFFFKKINDFKEWFEFHQQVQKIKENSELYNQTEQQAHPMYHSIILSKMFMLHDVKIINPFNSSYFFWINSDITTYCADFVDCSVLNNLQHYVDSVNKFVLLSYPYTTAENNGFKLKEFEKYCNVDCVEYICTGKIFGGKDVMVTKINNLYYNYLKDTLNNEVMETEECIFTIISYRHSDVVHNFVYQPDLLSFFEILKICAKKDSFINTEKTFFDIRTNLYVLTYNFPDQFERLVESFITSDINFLNKTKKYLLNNSTDESTYEKYNILCNKYDFEQIKKNNIGICGGRQFVAEHFEKSDSDYYIFFEDDMLLNVNDNNDNFCQNGFRKWIPNLYNKTLNIIHKEKYDFLKLNFTELYGGNEIQWAWYNVPDNIRHKYFPHKITKPIIGLDPDPPLTQFTNIKKYDDLTYIEGEIYYCNWPLWFSRDGNRKVFLEPKFEYPYEQTWMSLVFQKQKKNLFKVAVLLLSPINHNRIYYYKGSERKEN